MKKDNRKLFLEQLGRLNAEDYADATKIPVIIILDNVRSAHNVGSFFRTADSFRFQSIFLCGYTPNPPSKEIHKTALGSTETVLWESFPDTSSAVHKAREAGYTIVSMEQTTGSQLLSEFQFESFPGVALVFGNEVRGVDQSIIDESDYTVEIEQVGTKHSLNVSVCGGIVMWECFKAFKNMLA